MKNLLCVMVFVLTCCGTHAHAVTTYKEQNIDGVKIFYREAGNKSSPTMVLLHGYPTSSHMYRDLLPLIERKFHLIAPDYPGFGSSDSPKIDEYQYTFQNYADTVLKLLNTLKVEKFYLYLQDYGGPVGFRMAQQNPERILGLVIQNANAYSNGATAAYKELMGPYWKERTEETEKQIIEFMKIKGTLWEYQSGVKDLSLMNPDAWVHAQSILDKPGAHPIQLELRTDAKTNGAEYPKWQEYFRRHKPKTLIVWGVGDPIFSVDGAKAYQQDLKDAKLVLLDTGHFALEDMSSEIAKEINQYFD